MLFALALKTDRDGLFAYTAATADPASSTYRQFLDLPTIADRFGAPLDQVQADISVLAKMGITASADPTRGALWGSASAGTVKKVFGTSLSTVDSGGDQVVVPDDAPTLPPQLEGVTGAIGFTRTLQLGTNSPPVGSSACPPVDEVAQPEALAARYGFGSPAGLPGTGATVALLTVGAFEPASLSTYEACTGTQLQPDNVTVADVPLAPTAPGGTEAALDTVLLQAIAPGAGVQVIHIDRNASLVFPLLFLASIRAPEALAITLGYCETSVSNAEIHLAEWMLAALAATGTSTAAAAGDTGSTACPPSTSASVQYPASSAFVLSVGGAQYGGTPAQPVDLAVWNDGTGNAGGGGTSTHVSAARVPEHARHPRHGSARSGRRRLSAPVGDRPRTGVYDPDQLHLGRGRRHQRRRSSACRGRARSPRHSGIFGGAVPLRTVDLTNLRGRSRPRQDHRRHGWFERGDDELVLRSPRRIRHGIGIGPPRTSAFRKRQRLKHEASAKHGNRHSSCPARTQATDFVPRDPLRRTISSTQITARSARVRSTLRRRKNSDLP